MKKLWLALHKYRTTASARAEKLSQNLRKNKCGRFEKQPAHRKKSPSQAKLSALSALENSKGAAQRITALTYNWIEGIFQNQNAWTDHCGCHVGRCGFFHRRGHAAR
jgi:hypothetical protein